MLCLWKLQFLIWNWTWSFLSETWTCSFFSENHIVCTFILLWIYICLSAKNRSLEFIKYFICSILQIWNSKDIHIWKYSQNTQHNSQPANTDNPKLLLTIHNLPDYWVGGAAPSYSSEADNRPVRQCERRGRRWRESVVGPTAFFLLQLDSVDEDSTGSLWQDTLTNGTL